MKWVEIITLRSIENISKQFVDELLKGIHDSDSAADAPKHLVEIRIYHHSVLETDFSIHIYWKAKPGFRDKSPLALRFFSALRSLGLLNHSVWVETTSLEFPADDDYEKNKFDEIVSLVGSKDRNGLLGGKS